MSYQESARIFVEEKLSDGGNSNKCEEKEVKGTGEPCLTKIVYIRNVIMTTTMTTTITTRRAVIRTITNTTTIISRMIITRTMIVINFIFKYEISA